METRVVDVLQAEEIIPVPMPPLPGGRFRDDPKTWVRTNLFSSVSSSLLSVAFAVVFAYIAYRLFLYVFVTGRWEIVRTGLTSLMVGLNYPRDDAALARPWIAGYFGAVIGGLATGVSKARNDLSLWSAVKTWTPIAIAGLVIVALTETAVPKICALGLVVVWAGCLLVGSKLPVRITRRLWILYVVLLIGTALLLTGAKVGAWEEWGGLLLALYVAMLGIVVSFPLGMLFALGRRSKMPVARVLSTIWIELIRGVPLITLLFAGDLALRFFIPPGANPPGRVMRAAVMVILFSSAYIAEIIRGGLQSVPSGQVEAARALALGRFTTMRKVVLPQALRAVIPALVGQFISLFKDTSLLTIIGLLELIGVAETMSAGGDFRNQGLLPEILTFVGVMFWVCCYSMSKASQRLEKRMGVGVR